MSFIEVANEMNYPCETIKVNYHLMLLKTKEKMVVVWYLSPGTFKKRQ